MFNFFITKSRLHREKKAWAEKLADAREQRDRFRAERDQWRQQAKELRRDLKESQRTDFEGARKNLARTYLQGEGLEIGGLHFPLPVPEGVIVKQVDRMNEDDHSVQLAEDGLGEIVRVDIVCDGETLDVVADESQDFVIANHVFEHTEDPISTLKNWLRVVRSGGIVFMAVPDKRYTFDFRRPPTPFSHLVRDHEEGPETSRTDHYREWTKFVLDRSVEETAVRRLEEERENIHFHAWTQSEILELLVGCQRLLGIPFEIETVQKADHEVIAILRRGSVESYDRSRPPGGNEAAD